MTQRMSLRKSDRIPPIGGEIIRRITETAHRHLGGGTQRRT
nr:hypothetical protein JVH1_7958 [Rhodococcus sp. JVH1]